MSIAKYSIDFIPAEKPITEPITKFGGQPVWINQPQWPISRSTSLPMMFICQIALSPEIFGNIEGQMAYIFIIDQTAYHHFNPLPKDSHIDFHKAQPWNIDSGENGVIIQPNHRQNYAFETSNIAIGPTLFNMVKKQGHQYLQSESCEFNVQLTLANDPEFISEDEKYDLDEQQQEEYFNTLKGQKIGGTPLFIQSDAIPAGGHWRLLLQLDTMGLPFEINFGDMGVGYAFISEDGHDGKFLWQGC